MEKKLRNLIEGVASRSLGGRCLFCLYQPKVPKKLKENFSKDQIK